MIDGLRRFIESGNAFRILLSLALAFSLWAWVTNSRDPEQTYNATLVSVNVLNIAPSLQLVQEIPPVSVELSGPRSVIQSIEADEISASVDLAEIQAAGTYELDIAVDAPDGIRRARATPEQVTVVLGAVVQRTIDIEALPPAQLPRNLRITSVAVQPQQATVTGLASTIDQLEHVYAPITLENQTASFTQSVALSAVNASGVAIEGLQIEPAVARVSVDVEVRGKQIPVFVRCSCDDVADGYQVFGDPLPNPAVVVVDGPAELLAEVSYVYTTPIRTTGLDATTVIMAVTLDTQDLPEGITIEPAQVDVTVRIEQTALTRTIESVPIATIGIAPDARAVVDPATLSITVSGSRAVLDELDSSDVSLVVDLTGLEVGAHQVRPRAILPPGVSYVDQLPQVVVAIIDTRTTPVPTPPPTAVPVPEQTQPPANP